MKRIVISLAVVASGFPAFAEEVKKDLDLSFGGPYFGTTLPGVDDPNEWSVGTFSFGLWQQDSDTISSKFLEYRDIPNGAVAPFFRVQGKQGDYRYDLYGSDVTQEDQQYFGRFEGNAWKFQLDYTGIPHQFGNGGTSILIPVEEAEQTEWRISDTLQQAFQTAVETVPSRNYETLLGIVQPTLETQPTNIDIELQRNRLNLAFSLLPTGGNFNVDVTYFNERRTGTRTNNGTSFGFNNVVETADPMKYISQDFGIRASATTDMGLFFAGVNLNDFENDFTTFGWDNPWRASDSTSGNAYLGPTSTTAGPKTGLSSLFPSNQAWTLSGGTALKLGSRSRLSADLQYGQWTQNDQMFIAHTVNSAITTPSGLDATDPSVLPMQSLDGQIDVLALNGFFTSRLTDDLRLNARYRFYENDNQTPRVRFEEGYVRFDAVWEEIPRITVPFGFSSNYFDVYGTYDVGRVLGLELGYKYSGISRTFRETEDTTEGTVRAAADLRFGGGTLVRALYEFGSRDFDNYDAVEGEEHSFLEHGPPANQTVLRRYDQAKRDRNRIGLQAQYTPDSGIFSLSAAYFLNNDDYDDTPVPCQAATPADLAFCPGGNQAPLGLQEAEYQTFNVDFNVAPSNRLSFYALYSREDLFDFQTGRQSGGTVSFDPAFNWSSTVDNTIDTVGAGATIGFVPDVWVFDLFARYQQVDGSNDIAAGSALGPAEDIPLYDDTEINFVSAQLRHNFARNWTWGVGGFYEQYRIEDTLTGSVLNYMPGSFFINANNGDYDAWTAWLNLTFRFEL